MRADLIAILMHELGKRINRINDLDPALAILGENATPEDIALLHQAMGLDKPLIIQYLTFLGDYLTLNFGQSFISGREVITEIMARLPYTIELAVASVTRRRGGCR